MTLRDLLQKAKNEITNIASGAENKVSQGINNYIQNKTVFADPTSNNGQNYWSQKRFQNLPESPTAQFIQGYGEGTRRGLLAQGRFLGETGYQIYRKIVDPKYQDTNLPDTKFLQPEQIKNPTEIAKTGMASTIRTMLAVKGLANPINNLVGNVIAGGASYGINKLQGEDTLTAAREAGRSAGYSPVYTGINNITGPMYDTVAGGILGQAPKLLPKILTKGAINAAGNVLENEVFTPLTELRRPTKEENLTAGATGFLFTGATETGKYLKDMTTRSPSVEVSLKKLGDKWKPGDTPIKPPKMPRAQWDFQLKVNAKLGRNPYTPVYPKDLQDAIDLGLSVRVKGGTEAVLDAQAKADANSKLYDTKPINDYLTTKYGIGLEKATKSQINEALGETKTFIPYNETISKRVANPRSGQEWTTNYDGSIDRPSLFFGGEKQGVYTDGYIAILDKNKAAGLRNANIEAFRKREITRQIRMSGLSFAEASKIADAKILEGKQVAVNDYPDVAKIIPQEKGNPAFIQGYSRGNGTHIFTILSDGEKQALVNSDKLALINKLFPNARVHIIESERALPVVENGKIKALIMPIKGEGFDVPASYRPAGTTQVKPVVKNVPTQPLSAEGRLYDTKDMVTLYHASPNMPTGGNWKKGTYLATSPNDAMYYATSHHKGDVNVMPVSVPKDMVIKEGNYFRLKGEYPITQVPVKSQLDLAKESNVAQQPKFEDVATARNAGKISIDEANLMSPSGERFLAQQPISEVKPYNFVEDANAGFPGVPKIEEPVKPNTEKMVTSEAKQMADVAQINAEGNPKTFQDIFAKWIGKRDSAKTKATMVAKDFTNVPGDSTKIINAIEDRNIKVSGEQASYINKLRTAYDKLFEEAKASGIDMNYTKDYLTHIWEEPMSQVKAQYKAAAQKFGFSKDRVLPTYEEGIKMGLTPKYNNPAQILNEYVTKLEQTKANLELFNNLKDQGIIVHGSQVRGDPNFAPINAPGFPASRVKINEGETYVGNWYAPTEIAQKINQVFTPQDYGNLGKVTSGFAKASGTIQDVTLSGGLPGTPLNAWTFAQTQKEILGGNPLSPFQSIYRTLTKQDKAFFEKNAGQIVKMQERNIPVNTNFKIENMVDQSTIDRTFGEKVGKVWNAAVNDPTFQSFSPQLTINYFNKIEKAALNKGMSESEAADIAAQAVKNFYGITGSNVTAQRSKLGQDAIKAIFFAPKFRESMINFWANNVKALKNPLALENRANSIFIVGSLLTFAGMNLINKKNTGHYMWDNPSGKEDKMLIKTKDGYIGVPFESSIATMPRTAFKMGKQVLQGNLKGAALTGKGFLSSAIRPPLDIINNENYYGGQITDPNNPSWTDRAIYLAGQYNHPYIQAGLNVLGQNLPKDTKSKLNITSQPEPAYQTLSKALELPFRFYNNKTTGGVTQDAMQTAYYFDDRGQVEKSMDQQTLNLWNVLHPQSSSGRSVNSTISTVQKATILLNNPQVAAAEEALATAQKQRGEQVDPIWDLTPEQRKLVWASQIQLPGQKNTYDTYLSSQSWYKPYLQAREQYYATLPQTQTQTQTGMMAYPEPSPEVQAQMDAKNWKDPGVQAWFKARDEYNNQQLLALGLPTLSNGYSYNSKIAIKKFFNSSSMPKIKITNPKRSTFKISSPKISKSGYRSLSDNIVTTIKKPKKIKLKLT